MHRSQGLVPAAAMLFAALLATGCVTRTRYLPPPDTEAAFGELDAADRPQLAQALPELQGLRVWLHVEAGRTPAEFDLRIFEALLNQAGIAVVPSTEPYDLEISLREHHPMLSALLRKPDWTEIRPDFADGSYLTRYKSIEDETVAFANHVLASRALHNYARALNGRTADQPTRIIVDPALAGMKVCAPGDEQVNLHPHLIAAGLAVVTDADCRIGRERAPVKLTWKITGPPRSFQCNLTAETQDGVLIGRWGGAHPVTVVNGFLQAPLLQRLASGAPDPAQEKAKQAATNAKRVVVMPISVSPGLPEDLSKVLADALVGEIDRNTAYKGMTYADMENLLGHEETKAKLSVKLAQKTGGDVCTDTSCLSEVGGALGATLVVSGSLSKLGSSYVLAVQLLDQRKAVVISRFQDSIAATGHEEVLELGRRAARELFAESGGRNQRAWR